VVSSCVVVATTLTSKPYGSVFGLPPDVCTPLAPVSRPVKSAAGPWEASGGKSAFSAATETSASSPSSASVWVVVPSHTPGEGTAVKSPFGVSPWFG
jgi:hypothetical protein